jgi:hypothetical protein
VWTEEQREAMRQWMDGERRLALSLRRKAHPIGNRSKAWWAKRPDERQRAGERLNGRMPPLEDVFAQVDKVRKLLRRDWGW